MTGWLSSWWPSTWHLPWPFGGRGSGKTPDLEPVLLVPGICGTILHIRERGTSAVGSRVWVTLEHADSDYQKLWGKFNPETNRVELLDKSLEVFIPSHMFDTGGLYPVDVLDPDVLFPLHAVYYFHEIIRHFRAHGYRAGDTLFGFGYDFRQPNRNHVDDLRERLKQIRKLHPGRRINIISHSMGGLVVKALLAEQPEVMEEMVGRWITIATPFSGAPGFTMDALLTGIQFAAGWQAYFTVERQTMHQMCIESPAVFELLPPASFPWAAEPPHVRVWTTAPPPERDDAAQGGGRQQVKELDEGKEGGQATVRCEDYDLGRLRHLMQRVLAGNELNMGGVKVPMPMNDSCWKVADETQAVWARAKLPASTRFYSICGTGSDTPYSVEYGSRERPIQAYTDIRESTGGFTFVDGDSNVPAECALADGLDAVQRLRMVGTHRGLLESSEVLQQLLDWLHDGQAPTALCSPADLPPLPGQPRPQPHRCPSATDAAVGKAVECRRSSDGASLPLMDGHCEGSSGSSWSWLAGLTPQDWCWPPRVKAASGGEGRSSSGADAESDQMRVGLQDTGCGWVQVSVSNPLLKTQS